MIFRTANIFLSFLTALLLQSFVFAQKDITFTEQEFNKSGGYKKVEILIELIDYYQNDSLDKSEYYAKQAVDLYNSIKNDNLTGKLFLRVANTYRLIGKLKYAIRFYKAAYWYLKNDRNNRAHIINSLGIIYRYLGLYDMSLAYHIKAFNEYEFLNNKTGVIAAINNIGVVYRNLGQNEIARKLYLYALALNQSLISKSEKASTLINLGNVDWYEGKYKSAMHHYTIAMDISTSLNDNAKICGLYNNIANVLRDSGVINDAIHHYRLALKKNNKYGDKNLQAVILKNIGLTYYKINKIDSALIYFNNSLALANQGNLLRFEKDIYYNISNAYYAIKNFDKALLFYKKYVSYKDSIINEKTIRQFTLINEQFHSQQNENLLYKMELQRKQSTIYIFILIFIFGFILVLLIYFQYRQKRNHSEKLLKEIDERIKAQQIIHNQKLEIQTQYEELVSSHEELQSINTKIEESKSEISESEEKFRLLFENSYDGLFLMTETIFDCNTQACNMFDMPKEEIIGRGLSDLSPVNQPNGRNSEVMITEYINEALRGKKIEYNWRHQRRDGLLFECEITLIPIKIKNNQFIYTKIVDITKRILAEKKLKESEEKYSKLVNQLPIGIYRTDSEGNILFGNIALVKMLGYENIEELLNANINTFYINAEDRQKQLDELKKSKSNIIYSDEFKIKRRDGSTILVKFTDNVVYNENGEIEYFSGILEDLTEQKKTQEKLSRLIENFPGVVYRSLINSGSIMLFMSEETRHLTGFAPKEFINKNMVFSDIIHPADRKTVLETIQLAIRNNERFIINYRIITKKGQIKWVYEQGMAVSEMSNGIYEVEGFIIDITERKLSEEILKENEEKYRTLVENISEVLFTLTPEGHFTYFSPRIKAITGYNTDELIGKHFKDFIYHEDLPELINSYERTLSGIYEPAEFRIIDKGGIVRHVRTSSSLIKKNNEIIGISGIISDVSAQKDYEKIQTLLFKISQAANYTQSIDDFYNTLSVNLKEVIHTDNIYIALHNKQDDVVYFPFYEDIKDPHPGPRKFGNGLTEYVIRTKVPLLKDEAGLRDMFEKGECEQILSVAKSWLGVPLKTQDEIIGVLAIQSYSEDNKFGEKEKEILNYCSEQIALVLKQKHNEELERNIKLAERTAQIKQQFLANMSHEMRTPMNGILGMVGFLLQTRLDEKQLDYANTIKNSSETLRNLINDILDLSKIEAGSMKIIPNEFNIHLLLKEVVSLFKASIEQKGLSVQMNYSNDVPDYIIADKNRLNQIINNLISNAIKFTDVGEISIMVSKVDMADDSNANQYIPDDEKKIKVKIEVKDTGIGINPENQTDLFTLFSQIDSTYTRNYEGTGLGLAISKRLVEMMGGEIGVISDYGNGSTFWFTFDAVPVSEASVNRKLKVKSDFGQLNFRLHVLLVEDKYINQKVVDLMLKNAGCTIDIANNGAEALDMYAEGKYDLILMDIQMPFMDGVTAVKELQKKYSKLPTIIGLSANAMEGDAEKYIAEGMDDYLSKPVSTEQLNEKLLKWFPKKAKKR